MKINNLDNKDNNNLNDNILTIDYFNDYNNDNYNNYKNNNDNYKNNNDIWITVKGKKNKYNYNISKNFIVHEKNQKKMLCINILKNGECSYGNKCMYAHSLEEQNIDFIKKKAYGIIKSENYINIDLSKDVKLAKVFLQFTKICDDCKNKICSGGYNCKYGTMDEKYLICQEDLMTGMCNKSNCLLIHLTKKGIKPIIPFIKSNIENNLIKKKNNSFYIDKKDLLLNNIDSDDDSIETIEKMKKYFDEYDSDDNCEKSIFIYK